MSKGKNCPYCGTLYFDMSCIDFTKNEPIFIKFKVPCNRTEMTVGRGDDSAYITQCAIPELNTITVENESVDCTDYSGNLLKRVYKNRTATTDVRFRSIPFGGDRKELFRIEIKE